MRLIVIIGLVLLSASTLAQDSTSSLQQQLESLVEKTEEDIEDDSYLQQLSFFKDHPLNINTASADELAGLPFLTSLQIQQLILYRNALGALISIYELQSIPSWDIVTIQRVLPFVTIREQVSINERFSNYLRNGEAIVLARISRVIEKSKGVAQTNDDYVGDRNHYLLRYRYQYKNLFQYGVTADKDAGEPFFKQNNKTGFDFYSIHLFARNIGRIKSLAIGDYTVNLGQGLIQWQSLAFKKSSEVMAIKRQSPVLRPYTSSGEFYFNRGVGLTLKEGPWEATLFGSFKKLSANISIDSNNLKKATSFITSGLYRTASEIADKNSLFQSSFGGNLRFDKKLYTIGLNTVHHHFSHVFEKRDEPYNLFAWKGRDWYNVSVDYSLTYKNLHLFGEAAIDKQFHKAFINGAILSVHTNLDLSLLWRHIGKVYQAVYGNAFTESTLPGNESGLYIGMQFRPSSALKLNAYADVYQFPWLKYRVDAPGSGKDFLLQLTYQPNKVFELYTRYHYETKEGNIQGIATNYLQGRPKQNWRTHFSYDLSQRISLRARSEMVWYDKKGASAEEGFLLYIEAHYKAATHLSGNFRLAFFDTDGYNSRIYTYESDVLYAYSIPAFSDNGLRYYLNLQYKLSNKLSASMRWAQLVYNSTKTGAAGLNAPSPNNRTDIKVQLVYRSY